MENMKNVATHVVLPALKAAVALTLTLQMIQLLPVAAKPAMSAVTAMTATPAVLPEKRFLTAADIMTLTVRPVYLAQRRRRNRNVPLTATKADVIVILVLTVAAEQDNVAVRVILHLPNRHLIRHPHLSLNRKNRAVPIPAQAKDTRHPSPADSLVHQLQFAEAPVITIASQMTPVPE